MSIQGTPEWRAERCGKVTASRMAEVVAKVRSGGYGASRANYMAELIAERLTGVPVESFISKPMQWGIDHEAEARSAYEFYHDATVEIVGFVPHPSIDMTGASPDGLVGSDGLAEFKCPNTATHIETLLGKAPDNDYVLQAHWQLACTGRKWVDLVSYDPRLPPSLRLHSVRVQRDEIKVAELESEVGKFLGELGDKVAALLAIAERKAA